MSVINDYDLFRTDAMPAGLDFARFYLRADSGAANPSAHLGARRIALDLAIRRQGLFRLRIWPAFEVSSAGDGDTKATTVKAAITQLNRCI